MKLSQARMLVDDFGEALRFYRDELGLETSWGEEPPYASFAAGDGTVAIERGVQVQTVELRDAGDSTMVVLEVDDVDGFVERLRDRVLGAPVDSPDWGGRVAYVRDPSGNLIELFQPIPMSE